MADTITYGLLLVVLACTTYSALGLKCGECFGVGVDCKPKGYNDDCDYCVKLTGKIVDLKSVPESAMFIIRDNLPNDSDQQLKSKTLTMRKCASIGEIDEAGLKAQDGCVKHSNHKGFSGVSCMCKRPVC